MGRNAHDQVWGLGGSIPGAGGSRQIWKLLSRSRHVRSTGDKGTENTHQSIGTEGVGVGGWEDVTCSREPRKIR